MKAAYLYAPGQQPPAFQENWTIVWREDDGGSTMGVHDKFTQHFDSREEVREYMATYYPTMRFEPSRPESDSRGVWTA